MIFTRYLYIKDEVRIALLISILNKNKEEAMFWSDELYYSGFEDELVTLISKIVYDFFMTMNPCLVKLLVKNNYKEIIDELVLRAFNTDIFMLRNICEQFEIQDAEDKENDRSIAAGFLSEETPTGLQKLAKIMEKKTKKKPKKRTKPTTNGAKEDNNSSGILPNEVKGWGHRGRKADGQSDRLWNHRFPLIYGIDEYKWQSLFQLERYKRDTSEQTLCQRGENNALFIQWYQSGGIDEDYVKSHTNKTKTNTNTNTDAIMKIEKIHNWKQFVERFNKNGVFHPYDEELEEFDVTGLVY
jgi:hypothetical protein